MWHFIVDLRLTHVGDNYLYSLNGICGGASNNWLLFGWVTSRVDSIAEHSYMEQSVRWAFVTQQWCSVLISKFWRCFNMSVIRPAVR